MAKAYRIAVVGATGAVGEEILKSMEDRSFPIEASDLVLLASERSAGKVIDFAGHSITIQKLDESSFRGIDIAFFAAGSAISKTYVPFAVADGCLVIDNSSYYRMDPDVPLIVPEVNPKEVGKHKGIIANPNCSTIQMVVCLKPLLEAAGLKSVIVSTYQSVSGTGKKAIEELAEQTKDLLSGKEPKANVYPHRIAFNCLPHIDSFTENGYTKEEMKMVDETRKILNLPDLLLSATCVRVPVFYGHSEALWVETEKKLSATKAREILKVAPGILIEDEPLENLYPLVTSSAGRDEVFIGRIREDISRDNALTMWVVADNLRKGAATNAVEIAELLLRDENLLKVFNG